MNGRSSEREAVRPPVERQWEFQFSDSDFRCIRELAGRHTGIVLSEAKRDMVYSRLARRVRALGLRDFGSYCALLRDGGNAGEMVEFTNAITTNLTSFFREPHHFQFLQREVLPQLISKRASLRRIRGWSAGCSTGEEPYSLAAILAECVPAEWDVKVLATDLDSNVLGTARRGVYDEARVNGLPKDRLKRWFYRGRGGNAGKVRVSPALQGIIRFEQLNLLQRWPVKGPFDFVFCRNVMIYFDKPTQKRLTDRFAEVLSPGGHLFLGHSETLYRVTERYDALGQTVYRSRG